MGDMRISFFVIFCVINLVLSSKCPTNGNDPVNIPYSFASPQTSVTVLKNNVFLMAVSVQGCTTSSSSADYNVTCKDDKTKITLGVLNHVNGDVFHTVPDAGSFTIIYQEPATMTVDIISTITTDTVLSNNDKIIMEGQISSCTKPQPNIMWQYMYTTNGVITRTPIPNIYFNSTLDVTGCTVNLTKINSQVTISTDSVPIKDPFRVVCVLSYDVCTDNKYNTTTPYTITITGTPGGSDGLPIWAIVVIVIAVIVIVVLLGVGWCCYKNKEKKKENKGTELKDKENGTKLTDKDKGSNGRRKHNKPLGQNDVEKDETKKNNLGQQMTNNQSGGTSTEATRHSAESKENTGKTNQVANSTIKLEPRPLPKPNQLPPIGNNRLPPISGQRLN